MVLVLDRHVKTILSKPKKEEVRKLCNKKKMNDGSGHDYVAGKLAHYDFRTCKFISFFKNP